MTFMILRVPSASTARSKIYPWENTSNHCVLRKTWKSQHKLHNHVQSSQQKSSSGPSPCERCAIKSVFEAFLDQQA